MRISTKTIFESGVARMNELQSGLLKTQQQISSGKRVLTAADDPVAAARALEVIQGQTTNAQFADNRGSVKDALRHEESVLQGVTSLLQDVKTLTIQAGGVLDDTQRGFLASELRGRFEELLSLANTRDAVGNYLFGGYQTTSQPFVQTAAGAQYNGDQGQRMLQVGTARQMALSDSGNTIFEGAKNGNGTFATATGVNTGSGVISSGSIVDSTLLTGDSYTITFTVAAGVTTYDIVGATTGAVAPGGFAYTSGQSITAIPGLQFDISGTPADLDTFTVQPSTNQSMFTIVNDLITVLDTPAVGAAAKANLTNGLSLANLNIDNALDNILTVRADVGTRLKEIDALDSAGEDRAIQYAQTLEDLQGLDYAKAISELSQQQLTLEAAQKSFVRVNSLSVFNYI